MASKKMSFGRRLQRALADRLSGESRWKTFRLAADEIPLGKLGANYRVPSSPEVKSQLAADFDAQHDEATFQIDRGYATDHGATLTSSGLLVRELSREWNPQPEGHSRLQKPAWRPRVHRVEEAASITLEHNSNYCHFLMEGLPRLRILERCGVGREVLIYANAHKPFQRELLPWFGVPDYRLIDASRHPLLQAKKLWVPTYSGYQGKFSHEAIDYLRSIVLPKLREEAPLQPPTRKIYISRRDATSRRILNEAEIEKRLTAMGFECLCLAEMPVAQQLRAFAEAKVIIAAHGASLTNIVFSSPDAAMIEIFPDDFYFDCYQVLAKNVGVKAAWLRASSVQIGQGGLAQDLTITEQAWSYIVEILRGEKLA